MSRRAATGLHLLLLTLLGLLPAWPGAAAKDERGARELAGPALVTQLLRADVTGDGIADLILGSGRRIDIWASRRGQRPDPAPAFSLTLPDTVSFVDFLPPSPAGIPTLAVLDGTGLVRRRVDAPADAPTGPAECPEAAVTWRDARRVTFLDFVREGGTLLLPTPHGVTWRVPGQPAVDVALDIDASVEEAGPFLEDTTTVRRAHPQLVLGASPLAGSSAEPSAKQRVLWTLSGGSWIVQGRSERTRFDISYLPGSGDRRLLDLDRDGRPDLVHHISTNFDSRYAFFQAPTVEPTADGHWPAKGPRPGPARAALHLSGHEVGSDFVDLDGDGRLDLVSTSIEVDMKNTMGALTSGKVTATTRAFLGRAGPGAASWFAPAPDASVASEVGVRILFTYAGTIDVERRLTIVVDGDYDGDGRMDLAIRTGPERLTIWAGRPGGGWAPKGREVAIPPLGRYANIEGYAYDADGDGKDELLLLYRITHRDGSVTGGRERVFLLSP